MRRGSVRSTAKLGEAREVTIVTGTIKKYDYGLLRPSRFPFSSLFLEPLTGGIHGSINFPCQLRN